MTEKLSLFQKISRLRGRLSDSEWRRYGMLVFTGKMTAIGLLFVDFVFFNPGLDGLPVLRRRSGSEG
jgi:hypothetical protein